MEAAGSTPPEATPPPGSARRQAEPLDRRIAAVCIVLLLIGMPVGYLSGGASTGEVIGMFALIAVSLALMAWLLNWLVPRQRALAASRAARTALILGALTLVTVLLFWTGIPFALGAGAIALGYPLREAAPQGNRGQATAAVALGTLGVAASFAALLIG